MKVKPSYLAIAAGVTVMEAPLFVSKPDFGRLFFPRLGEGFIDECQDGLHRLPLFGVDILDAVDAAALGIDIVFRYVDAHGIRRAFIGFAKRLDPF